MAARHRWSVVLAAGCLVAIEGAPLRAQSRRALVIGIDQYVLPPGRQPVANDRLAPSRRRDPITNLDGALNDAVTIRDLLIARFAFPAGNVRLLANGEATRTGILAAIEQLANDTRAGDVVAFYYAGHGSQRRNSLSSEPSRLDQTIVPADANLGGYDLRDKELARAFNTIIDKGATLTLIFDSCHSGSIVRGVPVSTRIRWAAVDPDDAKDPYDAPRPEDRGAVVISAAQDFQTAAEMVDDDGVTHGVFTNALMKAIRASGPDEPVAQVFQSTRAIMQSDGKMQEPVLAGPMERRRLGLFGEGTLGSGSVVIALARLLGGDSLEINGGLALGLRAGAELALVGRNDNGTVRLRVTRSIGLSRSAARVVEGDVRSVRPGAQFAVTGWTAAGGESLRVWVPDAVSDDQLRSLAARLSDLRDEAGIEWVDDPTTISDSGPPLYTLFPGASDWQLYSAAGMRSLGPDPSRTAIAAAVRNGGDSGRLLVVLPPTAGMRRRLRIGPRSGNDAVTATVSMADAHYLLIGTLVAGVGIRYAWVLPNATATLAANSALPVRTDWTDQAAGDSILGSRLGGYALRLAKLRAWLRLESPPDDGRFPYRLALRNERTDALITDGSVRNGEGFELVVRADPARLDPDKVERRRVYVFAIDSHGKQVLLYPNADVQNRVPVELAAKYPTEIRLGPSSRFTISPPFGVDTYFLLSSDEAISTDALSGDGVRTRAAGTTALSLLLSATGAASRAPAPALPASWSLERLTIRSTP